MTSPLPDVDQSTTRTPSQASPFAIRPARTDDPAEVARLYEICLLTGSDGGDATARTTEPRLLGEIYLGAYLRFAPELAFVVVDPEADADDAASVVGYVIGTADTAAFEATLDREWWPELRARYPLGTFPEGSYDANLVANIHGEHHSDPATLDRFPAHLHIDLVPRGQGGGNGRRLLTTLFDALRAAGAPGVHLGVSTTNTQATGFYAHIGFQKLSDDGALLGLVLSPPA
ncbi:Acetyltransferase (GNAT) family protein [Sanguibacter gelidistatuariae]|uniref:Acetyltransferase (GNAT) family protein n=1 Tax=Sanguibacter gelidistatuariae TaxID=1814289 RepID=A0A1G6GWK4_9MICO|nr:GNAT family N-acetyltransferase [Sanguibacter gelidistatuariae]SDB86422.1 Acetyltransferase (GNAT) family protein [Sanguibacter gelidistatuariae]